MQTMFYSPLREPITSSTTQQSGVVVQSSYITKQVMLTFNGTNNFIGNSADNDGGVIYSLNHNILIFNGSNNFIGNSANNSGDAIYTSYNTVLNFTGTNNFIGNHGGVGGVGCGGGVIYISDYVLLTFNGTNNFINSSAEFGGAICAEFKILVKSLELVISAITLSRIEWWCNLSRRLGCVYIHWNQQLHHQLSRTEWWCH